MTSKFFEHKYLGHYWGLTIQWYELLGISFGVWAAGKDF